MLEEVGLSEIPDGDWFCAQCAKSSTTTSTRRKGRGAATKAKEEETVQPGVEPTPKRRGKAGTMLTEAVATVTSTRTTRASRK